MPAATDRPPWVDDAPLLRAWYDARDAVEAGTLTPFTIPGHKQRTDLIGEVVRGDIPLYAGLATMKQADVLLADAEHRAAAFFGADWCRFSVGGSTHGNQAFALAVGRPGDTVVVARTLHRSVLLGLVLADLVPVWVRPALDPLTGLPRPIETSAVRDALAAHPDACAVILTEPSYLGICADLRMHADLAHAAGVPLIVDAAWGAHFGLHPRLPAHPLAAGADAVVTSAHKTLPAANQGAYLLARTAASGGLLDAARLDRAFAATHTTSPSGAILASLDGARALIASRGGGLVDAMLAEVDRARRELAAVPGLIVLPTERPADQPRAAFDPAKLVLLLAGTGAHGHDVEADLIDAGLPVEMADRDVLVPMVTLADDAGSIRRLVREVIASVTRHRGPPRTAAAQAAWTVEPVQVVPPRAAFFADSEAVPWYAAAGRVCAEVIAPYPPGVPVLAPGERVDAQALRELAAARADGARIAYAADPTLATVQVLSRD